MSAQIKMFFTALLLAGLVTAGCSQEPKSATGHVVKIQLTSAAFGGVIFEVHPPMAGW